MSDEHDHNGPFCFGPPDCAACVKKGRLAALEEVEALCRKEASPYIRPDGSVTHAGYLTLAIANIIAGMRSEPNGDPPVKP